MARAAARVTVLALAASSLGAQCQGDPSVTVEVLLPDALAGTAQWMEVGVLHGSCPPPSQLAGGLPDTGMVTHVAFEKGNTAPPWIGRLPKASYAFAAAARAADCSVVAAGCTSVDLTSSRDVGIPLTPVQPSLGACAPGDQCVDARCLASAGTGGGASPGAGCSMVLVGAGPLGDPLDTGSTDVASYPAVVATETGFLVAYREYDPDGGSARVTVAAVDAGGGLSIPPPATLPDQCPNEEETDAVGMAHAGGAGVVVSARPACSGKAGFDVFALTSSGALGKSAFSPSTSGKPVLHGSHSVALTSASGPLAGWIAYTDATGANAVALSGTSTQGTPIPFGGAPPQSLAQVAASTQAVALLAGASGAAGADAGAADGDAGAADADAAAPTAPTLSVLLAPSIAPADAGEAPSSFPGRWGSLALSATRAFVLSDAPAASAQPLEWHAFDLSPPSVTRGTFAPPSTGDVSGGDVVVQGGRALFAVEQPGAISVVVLDHASTTPTPLRSVLLSADPRIPSQASVRDGRVAIAASATQVLVAWLNGTRIDPTTSLGGWALYACSP